MITAHLPPIYLASSSLRRQELLKQVGIDFMVVGHEIDEQRLPNESPEEMVVRLALEKAQDAASRLGSRPPRPVLGADTVVVIGDEVLGKPSHREDSLRMLALLSGQTHRVMTGVAVVLGEKAVSRLSISQVSFSEIPADQAQLYWETGEPLDKSGSYGVQGVAGIFIRHIEGSCTGIMGLPLYETYSLLQEFV